MMMIMIHQDSRRSHFNDQRDAWMIVKIFFIKIKFKTIMKAKGVENSRENILNIKSYDYYNQHPHQNATDGRKENLNKNYHTNFVDTVKIIVCNV